MLNFIKNISPTEVIIVAVIIILIFGSKIATKLGKTSGETFKEIKNIKKSFTEAIGDDQSDSNKKGV